MHIIYQGVALGSLKLIPHVDGGGWLGVSEKSHLHKIENVLTTNFDVFIQVEM